MGVQVLPARKASDIAEEARERSSRQEAPRAADILKDIDELILNRARDGHTDLTYFWNAHDDKARTREVVVASLVAAGYRTISGRHGLGGHICIEWLRSS